MMKKIFKCAIVAFIAFGSVSCATITRPIGATSNPVGNKVGVTETVKVLGLFGGKDDAGINTAAKNGGITRISHMDAYQRNYILWVVYGVRVYGE